MLIAIPVAVVLILALLYALFNNFTYCLLTLASVPFTVFGGILALYATGQVLSISAVIGFISLLGVSVMDGILIRSEEHTSELQSQSNLVCRLLLEKKKTPRK